jgi:Ca2+-binding EF-hand superfamily protein
MSISEAEIKKAVESVFKVYDKDKSGTLDQDEVNSLINDALKQMKQNKQVTVEDVKKFI